MTDYLLELGVEEFPADYVESTKDQLKTLFKSQLTKRGIRVDSLQVESTPRRFAVILFGLNIDTSERTEEVKGPSVKVAYNDQGQPTKALQGFMRSKGLTEADLHQKDLNGADYVYGTIKIVTESLETQLSEMVPEIIRQLTFPKSMKWGGKNLRFARPLRWIVSILDKEVLDFDLEGISVGRITRGHRVLGSDNLVIPSVADYENCLLDNAVILKQSERREIIIRGINRLAKERGGSVLRDESLLDEVVNIVEYPTPLLGNIKSSYLDLPKEVIITPMKDHQRYFPVLDDTGALLPYFITVRNGDEDGIENVRLGNEKVLSPRLEDADFFFKNDLEKDLDTLVEALNRVTFHESLGSVYQKTDRLKVLSSKIAQALDIGKETIQNIQRAAYLCKFDLTTSMVIEFTELQGVMGRIYAAEKNESPIVAQAIYEHYLPRYAADELPETTAGTVLAIADKLDTLCGLYAVGVRVTGSQDPYALRRAALGLIRILLSGGYHLSLRSIISDTLYTYVESDGLVFDYAETSVQVMQFIMQRFRVQMIDEGYRYDIIDSVIETGADDLSDMKERIQILTAWINEPTHLDHLTSFVRLQNLAEKAESDIYDSSLIDSEYEEAVYALIQSKQSLCDAIERGDYGLALNLFGESIEIIDHYLDNCMIMVDDKVLRSHRLALLNQWYQLITKIFVPGIIVRQTL